MSTAATHLNGAARAFPREAIQAPPSSAPRTNEIPTKDGGFLATVAETALGFGRWMSMVRSAAKTSQAVENGRELDLEWLMLGASPVMQHRSRTPERCCRDY